VVRLLGWLGEGPLVKSVFDSYIEGPPMLYVMMCALEAGLKYFLSHVYES